MFRLRWDPHDLDISHCFVRWDLHDDLHDKHILYHVSPSGTCVICAICTCLPGGICNIRMICTRFAKWDLYDLHVTRKTVMECALCR